MSFAGKKITAVSGSGQVLGGHHQTDATKRLSVNLQSGFVNKVANNVGMAASSNGFQQQQMLSNNQSKVR